jgi:hypothetical protein
MYVGPYIYIYIYICGVHKEDEDRKQSTQQH